MLAIRSLVRFAAIFSTAPLFFSLAPPAYADPFVTDSQPVGQSTATDVIIRGKKGDSFTITYVDAAGVTRTKTVTLTLTNFPQRTTVPAGKNTNITITNTTEPGETPQTEKSLAFAPGEQRAVTTLAVNAGSTFTAFGQTFTLGGSFETVATSYDIDPASANYGALSGQIPSSAFSIVGQNGPVEIDFALSPPGLPFAINVASVLDADLPDTGISTPFTQPLSGFLTVLGSTVPFTGEIDGEATFFTDNVETISGTITLFGIGSGEFSATGQTFVVPEPATWLLLGLGLPLAMLQRRRLDKVRGALRGTGALRNPASVPVPSP